MIYTGDSPGTYQPADYAISEWEGADPIGGVHFTYLDATGDERGDWLSQEQIERYNSEGWDQFLDDYGIDGDDYLALEDRDSWENSYTDD